jgi:hypothetical protein
MRDFICFRLRNPELHEPTLMRLTEMSEHSYEAEYWLDFALAEADVNAFNMYGYSFTHSLLSNCTTQLRLEILHRIPLDVTKQATDGSTPVVFAFSHSSVKKNEYFMDALEWIMRENPNAFLSDIQMLIDGENEHLDQLLELKQACDHLLHPLE